MERWSNVFSSASTLRFYLRSDKRPIIIPHRPAQDALDILPKDTMHHQHLLTPVGDLRGISDSDFASRLLSMGSLSNVGMIARGTSDDE